MKPWYVYEVNAEAGDSYGYPESPIGGPFPNAKAAKEWMVKQVLNHPELTPSQKEVKLLGLNTSFDLTRRRGFFNVPWMYMQAELSPTKEDSMFYLSYIRNGERYVLAQSESYDELYRMGEFYGWVFDDEDGSDYPLTLE